MNISKSLKIFLVLAVLGILISWLWIVRPFVFNLSDRKFDIPKVNTSQLRKHVEKLSTEFLPRDYYHPENLDRTAKYIKEEFLKSGSHVEEQLFEIKDTTYKNVIAKYGNQASSLVIVGAHYDAFGNLPGADDNASGVAGLLELGKLLAKHPVNVPVELVAYTLEEPPTFATDMMGSAVHALSVAKDNVRLMVSLEMIGYFTEEPDSQSYPVPLLGLFYPSKGNFITVAGDFSWNSPALQIKRALLSSTNLPTYSINAPKFIPGIDFSDHRNYWNYMIPAVMLTDTAFYRNKAYHTEGDTLEKLDYEKMGEVVRGLYFYLSNLK